VSLAGPAAEGFEAVYPYDPTQHTQQWLDFVTRFEAKYHELPDHFAALAYDAMRILLESICRAGMNRGRIRDALTGIQNYEGVTGKMVFDPNCKNISALFLASVHNGAISYRRITMDKPYAQVGESGVSYSGPAVPDIASPAWKIAVFGPRADQAVNSPEITQLLSNLDRSGHHYSLIAIPTESSWGKASTALVQAVDRDQALGIIALDRDSSHLAEQIGVKLFVPVLGISSDKMLTSANVPWIFRLPEGSPLSEAVTIFAQAAQLSGANRGNIREFLASGETVDGVRFNSTGEMR